MFGASSSTCGVTRVCRTSQGFRRRFASTVTTVEVRAVEERADRAVVQSGEDRLEICRVINGMWQTSGGWGKIERNQAVGAMLNHVDAGFTTFDMADHCKSSLLLACTSSFSAQPSSIFLRHRLSVGGRGCLRCSGFDQIGIARYSFLVVQST
jgi:hypothetical protein